jgi:hypothetical protein
MKRITFLLTVFALLQSRIIAQEYIPDANTVALYHFNETSGSTVSDASGNGNNGVATGTTIDAGKFGNARSFNGSTDYIKINGSSSLTIHGSMTIEAWIKPTGTSNRPILEYGDGLTNGVHVWQDPAFDRLYVNFVDVNNNNHMLTSPSGTIILNQWQHIAAVYDSATGMAYVYRNGVSVASSAIGQVSLKTSYDVYIGIRKLAEYFYYTGLIDEVRISNKAHEPWEFNLLSNYPRTTGSIIDCNGPIDANGRNWYEPQFYDLTWQSISLPDNGWGPENSDRYYRDKIVLPEGIDSVKLSFSSDDGIWAYINGAYLGHWGGLCHEQGCVNGSGCIINTTVPPQDISSFILPGVNTLAFHVSNAIHAADFSYSLTSYGNTNSTILILHLDETSGDIAYDASGNGNNGTATGTTIVDGKVGKARSFNGYQDHISLPNTITPSQITLEAWINNTGRGHDPANRGQAIITKEDGHGNSSNLAWRLYIQPNTFKLNTIMSNGTSNILVDSKASIELNTWYHVAATYDGSSIKLYINGELDTSVTANLGALNSTTSLPLRIGAMDYFSSPDYLEGFEGIIDEVRISNKALEPWEFNFCSNGLITGVVRNANTFQSISNALISVKDLGFNTHSDSIGRFQLMVPIGSGYNLEISADGYLQKEINNVIVTAQGNVLGTINLLPLPEQEFDLMELSPNPNPQISEVETDGASIRYYKVVGKKYRLPENGIEVQFETQNGGILLTDTSGKYLDMSGILRVEIPSSSLGCTSCQKSFRVKRIHNNTNPNSPINFTVNAKPRKYQKDFELQRDIEIGLGVATGGNISFQGGDNTTARLSMIETDGNPAEPDTIGITEEFQSKAGVEVGVGIGTKLTVLGGGVGVYGGLSGGGYIIMEGNGNYLYGYNSESDQLEKRSKLYNLALAAITLDPSPILSRVAFVLSDIACWNYLESVGGGVGVKGVVSGEAFAGVFSSRKIGIAAGAGISGSGEVGATLNYDYLKRDNLHQGSLSLFGNFEGNAGISIFNWQYANRGNPNFKKWNQIKKKSPLWDLPILSGEINTEVQFKNTTKSFGMESSLEVNGTGTDFSFDISHDDLDPILNQSYLRGLHSLSNPSTPFLPLPLLELDFLDRATDNLLSNIADGQENGTFPPIEYKVDTSKTSTSGGFSIGVDWLLGLKFNLGLSYNWKTSHSAKKESGVFLVGNEFPLEQYNNIPEVTTPTPTVLWKILSDGFSTFNLTDLFQSICFFCPGGYLRTMAVDTTFIIAPIGSTISFNPTSLPPGQDSLSCQTWNWYGSSTKAKMSDLPLKQRSIALAIKKQQQSIAKLDYGIGGFYKFSPQAVPLSSAATLTIVYPDSDVVGIDENNLAVFCQDTVTSKWHYVGGSVDTINNKITVHVDTLQLYTIAPIMPDGEIKLKSSIDTLFNDSTSMATIWADTLKLSNGDYVGETSKYTIRAENVSIVATDADTSLDGIQVNSINSRIEFQVRSQKHPGKAKVRVESVYGSSVGLINIFVKDTLTPAPPTITSFIRGDHEVKLIVSKPDTSGISQYEVSYATHSGEPYNGHALVGGENSPFTVPATDTIVVSLLQNDTTYYFAIKGIDVGNNKSPYSNEVPISPHDTIPPGRITSMEFTCMPDSSYLVRWIAGGDNGYVGRASKYYIKVSNEPVIDTSVWWSTATNLSNVTAPNDPGNYDYHIISGLNIDSTYYVGIQVEDEVVLKSPISLFRITENRVTRATAVKEGWNLISHPIKPRGNPSSLYPYFLGGPFSYSGSYTLVDSFEQIMGYWIKVSQGYQKDFNGEPINDTIIVVNQGWNMIGGNSSRTAFANLYSVPPGLISSSMFEYDGTGYAASDSLIPGSGYWIRVSQACSLIIGKSPALLKRISAKNFKDKGFIITTNNKITKNLWLVDNTVVDQFEAPPLPPEECLEIRFSSNRYVENANSELYEVNIQGAKYPLSIGLKNINKDQFEVRGGISGKVYGVLTTNKTVNITDGNDKTIIIRKFTIPNKFAMDQNYPNPFNPITIIKYQLPVDSRVNLRVYDILGREVITLINGEEPAGYKSIDWNASSLASSVYFYRLEATSVSDPSKSFIQVRKMILIK